MQFDGVPFERPVQIHKYTADRAISWQELGAFLRRLRAVTGNRNTPIIQDGMELYSTVPLVDGNLGLLVHLNGPESVRVSPSNEEGRLLIERILGEAVAVFLRTQTNDPWKIEEVSRTVYEVSHPIALEGYWEIKVHKGFRYQPLVMESGKAGLIIDPKFKFHSAHHLRTLIEESGTDYASFFESNVEADEGIRRLVDTCPIDDCIEKTDPFSICKLAGTGTAVEYQTYSDSLPSATKPNLLEYHSDERVCPRSPWLRDALVDAPPVILAAIHQREYWYPIERLRLFPTFSRLREDDRSMLMDKVRPFPQDRFAMTEYFGSRLSSIRIEGFGTVYSKGFRSSVLPTAVYEFSSPELMVGGNWRTQFPHRELPAHGPADSQEWTGAALQLYVVYGTADDKDVKLLLDIICGEKKDPIIPSMESFLGMKVGGKKLISIGDITPKEAFATIKSSPSDRQHPLCVLIAHSERYRAKLGELEALLIQDGTPKQGISIQEFRTQYNARMKGYFRNIYLGIYAKIGGYAWLLPEVENPSTVFVGLSSKIVGDDYHCVLSSFTNNGRLIAGRYIRVNKGEASTYVIRELKTLTEGYGKTLLLILGKDFVMGYGKAHEIASSLSTGLTAIEITNSPIRIYKYHGQKVLPPDAGAAVEIRPGSIALVTVRMPFGTPDPVVLDIVYGSPQDLRSQLGSIFKLTQCYTGYEKFSLKLPVPLHAANAAMKAAIRLGLSSFSFDKAWYV